ncbi:MAG: TadE family protein [Acidimicrobiia bacterium]
MRFESERGASAVEMALVTPLFLLLVLGIVDLGRALYTDLALKEAAQEGAIYASFEPFDPLLTIQRITSSIDNPTLTAANIGIDCSVPDQVAVTVTYDHDYITPILGPMLGGNLTLSRTFTGQIVSENTCSPYP